MKKIFILCFTLLILNTASASATPLKVDISWLKKHINDENVVLVDMSSDQTQYQRFHIPGAIYVDYGYLVKKRKKDKVSLRIPDDHLYKILGLLGIKNDSHIVIYDDMGGLNAGRLYWQLERIGHEKVSVVDGGLVKWILEGNKVTNVARERKPVNYSAAVKITTNEVSMQDVIAMIGSDKQTILDVRSKEEYAGSPKYKRSGHVPGARLWSWDDSVDFANGFVLKTDSALEKSLARLDVTDKKKPLVLYCRSGHRAAQSYLVLKQLGFENVRLFDGSMSEYTKNKNAPVQKGLKP